MARVLLLEDDASLRNVLMEAITDEGLAVEVCASPDELLQRVTDADLAVVDGFGPRAYELENDERESLQRIAHCVPTILISGRPWSTPELGASLGMAAALPKPFDLLTLLEALQRARVTAEAACAPQS